MLRTLFLDFTGVSVQVGIIVAVFMICLKLISRYRKIASKWIGICWLIVALRLLIPYSLTDLLPEINISKAVIKESEYVLNRPTFISEAASDAVKGMTEIKLGNTVDLIDAAAIVWLAGIVICLLHQITAYLISRKRIMRWSSSAGKEVSQKAEAAATNVGLKRCPGIYVCRDKVPPMLLGVIKPVIILPDGVEGRQIEVALLHELTHLRRCDNLFKLLLAVVNAFHWFNPVVWIMVRTADKALETACDESVLADADIAYRREYCITILDMMCISRIPFATALSYKKEDIMKRFKNILDCSKRRSGALLVSLLFCALLMLNGFAGCTSAKENEVSPTVTENKTETIQTQSATTTESTTAETTTSTEDPFAALPEGNIIYDDGYMDPNRAMELINDYRIQNGLPPLQTGNEYLNAAAQVRIMEAMEQFSHTRPNGQRYASVFTERGISYTFVCENLARGQTTAGHVVREWLSSPTHQANIINPNAIYGCVACAQGEYDGYPYVYWLFMAYAP